MSLRHHFPPFVACLINSIHLFSSPSPYLCYSAVVRVCSLRCLWAPPPLWESHICVCEGRTSFLSGCGVQQGGQWHRARSHNFLLKPSVCVCPCGASIHVHPSVSWPLWPLWTVLHFRGVVSMTLGKSSPTSKGPAAELSFINSRTAQLLINPKRAQLSASLASHKPSERLRRSIQTRLLDHQGGGKYFSTLLPLCVNLICFFCLRFILPGQYSHSGRVETYLHHILSINTIKNSFCTLGSLYFQALSA